MRYRRQSFVSLRRIHARPQRKINSADTYACLEYVRHKPLVQYMVEKTGAHIFVAQIPSFGHGYKTAKSDEFNASFHSQVMQMVDAHAATGRVHLVDMRSAFHPTNQSSDGVHPTRDGYKAIAQVWATAIIPHLN